MRCIILILDHVLVLMLNNDNQVKAALKLEHLIKDSDVKYSQMIFRKPPSLKVMGSLLIAIIEESKKYRLWRVSIASASS